MTSAVKALQFRTLVASSLCVHEIIIIIELENVQYYRHADTRLSGGDTACRARQAVAE